MKKSAVAFICLVLALILTACTKAESPELYLEKAELTVQEQALLSLVGPEKPPYILRYAVDDTVQSFQINTYELQDGQWKLIVGGGGLSLSESAGRIGLTFDNIAAGMRIGIEGQGATSYKTEPEFDFEGFSTTTSYLTNETAIEYEAEIPLVIQVHTTKSEISSLTPEEGFDKTQLYTEAGYEKVYAVTCTFSQKPLDGLTAQK